MDKKPIYSTSLYKHSELTEQIIGAFYDVYSKLGYGFLEDVYVKALVIELKKRGLIPDTEQPIEVYYEGQLIGKYYADVVVNNLVIVDVNSTGKCNR